MKAMICKTCGGTLIRGNTRVAWTHLYVMNDHPAEPVLQEPTYLQQRAALAAVIKEAQETFYKGTTNWGLPYDTFVAERVLKHLEQS